MNTGAGVGVGERAGALPFEMIVEVAITTTGELVPFEITAEVVVMTMDSTGELVELNTGAGVGVGEGTEVVPFEMMVEIGTTGSKVFVPLTTAGVVVGSNTGTSEEVELFPVGPGIVELAVGKTILAELVTFPAVVGFPVVGDEIPPNPVVPFPLAEAAGTESEVAVAVGSREVIAVPGPIIPD